MRSVTSSRSTAPRSSRWTRAHKPGKVIAATRQGRAARQRPRPRRHARPHRGRHADASDGRGRRRCCASWRPTAEKLSTSISPACSAASSRPSRKPSLQRAACVAPGEDVEARREIPASCDDRVGELQRSALRWLRRSVPSGMIHTFVVPMRSTMSATSSSSPASTTTNLKAALCVDEAAQHVELQAAALVHAAVGQLGRDDPLVDEVGVPRERARRLDVGLPTALVGTRRRAARACWLAAAVRRP